MGAIKASLGPVGLAGAKLLGFEVPMGHFECEWICSRAAFCFANISPPINRTKRVLYSKFAYGSQFSGEKSSLLNFTWFKSDNNSFDTGEFRRFFKHPVLAINLVLPRVCNLL